MSEPDQPTGSPDVQALTAEIARLNKVVDALMDRSESATNVQGSDFGLFQTTIMLQDQVRLRSEELEAAVLVSGSPRLVVAHPKEDDCPEPMKGVVGTTCPAPIEED